MSRRRWLGLVAAMGACGSFLLVPPPAPAATPSPAATTAVGRAFDVRTGGLATGLYTEVSRPQSLPFDPILPVSLAAAEGNIDDRTGETIAFSSALYPGDILSSAGGLVGLVGFPIGGTVLPDDHPISQLYASLPNLLPPWPFEARASHPDRPGERIDLLSEVTRSVLPLPVPFVLDALVQDANAAEGFAASSASFGRIQVNNPLGATSGMEDVLTLLRPLLAPLVGDADPLSGFLLDVAGLRSQFGATVSTGGVEVSARTEASSIAVLGGLLRLGDVRAGIVLRSDGVTVEVVEQGYDIGVVTLAGVSVRLDEGGVHIADSRIPLGGFSMIEDLLNRLLDAADQAGVAIEFPKFTEAGASRGVQLLELRVRGVNPGIPFALPAGEATLTLRLGEVAARLETFPRPAPLQTSTGAGGRELATASPRNTPPVGAAARLASRPGPPSSPGAGLAAGPSSPPASPNAPFAEPVVLTAAQIAALELGDLTRTLVVLVATAVVAAAFGWRRRTGFR